MTRKMTIVVSAAALLAVAAYVSANYLLSPAIVDSGGGHADSSNYQVDASIGGPVIAADVAGGTASSASYNLKVNSMGLLEGPAAAPGKGGGGGGCVGVGSGAGPLALLLSLGVPAFLKRRRETARA